ncbi:MAG: hypothetical protein JO328_05665 [Hyphomicrobiales bacterium]|nr:hypothetical protein [Hyphomicrobiales bacterium]MBV8826684.1 hypothetical protein [Hyphomicrobiales bacterium]
MAYTFDSLGYAKKLRDRGVSPDQAEAHAEAARDFIMAELVTKADLAELATKANLLVTKQELQTDIAEVRHDMETQTLRLTVRFGTMLVVGFGALATILTILKLS